MERDRNLDNNEDKALDPYSALDKLIRLNRKHMNFEYKDSLVR
jgi:hypothetical protein